MRLKFKLLIILSLLISASGIEAQEEGNPWNGLTTKSNFINYKIPGKLYFYQSFLRGSEFLYNDWNYGSLVLENGEKYDSLVLKVNTFLDELVVFNNRIGAHIQIDKNAVSEFQLNFKSGESVLFKKKYSEKIFKGYRYFQVLYEGKLNLIVWYKTEEQLTSNYRDALGMLRNSELLTKNNYYLELTNGEIIKFTPKRKSLASVFPENKKAIIKILRKNRNYLKNDGEIIRAVERIESEFNF
ncbi:MAG: hypothetical protein JXR31_06450 [Prolixibacteraceae bacterium]|nr:hypothetical protein [Prolixibacteraceae bacterium]MBN2773870.1 hypothetical protein [Prolixibacteraceae bacterium]